MSMHAVTLADGPVPRVLLASPDAAEREAYGVSLHAAGCDVVEALDGRDALAKAFVRAPSLVVSDTQLPFIDGYTLCELLRQDSQTHSVPIILVTEDARQEDVDRGRQAGATVVVARRSPETLLHEARRLFAQSRELSSRSHAVLRNVAVQLKASSRLRNEAQRARRRAQEIQQPHVTIAPSLPPTLHCPNCDRRLIYQHSYTGGVGRHPEQWDYFTCPGACGTFQYRQRTRSLRLVR